ncbi:AMP-binding protein [Cytophagaceae bacterium ABcell3]|nr:AMP-binding protein [Cytophagaceae bacterium ABcell3]
MFTVVSKKPVIGLTDNERFPLIKDLAFLNKLRQDEYAPAFNFLSGDRLNTKHLEQVKKYAKKIVGEKKFWEIGTQPEWINDYLSWCIKTVPYYKNRSGSLKDQPTIKRKEVATFPWDFVSTEANIGDLLVHQTSGSTDPAMDVLFDPATQACWIPQLESILHNYGIKLNGSPEQVAIALICSQRETLTYASLSTYLSGAGVLKINLNADDWRESSHRLRYLEKYNPQILTGDPFAFYDLLNLKPSITPKALVSSAMKLTKGIRKRLEDYFNCPVIDLYSLTECRMIAYAEGSRYRAIRPELYLEVFDKGKDILLPYGERGELVITGGINPFLPLIRYRTGDFCSMEVENGVPYLVDLEARSPVPFYTKSGILVNNVEISRGMTFFPLAGFTLHQNKLHHLTFTGWSDEDIEADIVKALTGIFKEDVTMSVSIQPVKAMKKNKVDAYSSEFELGG